MIGQRAFFYYLQDGTLFPMPLFNEFNRFPESIDKRFAFRAVFQMLIDIFAKGRF
jgi:hypothetical protein